MTLKHLILLILLAWLLSACTPQATPLPSGPLPSGSFPASPTAPATQATHPTSTHTAASSTPALIPSATLLPPNPTSTSTPIIPAEARLSYHCLDVAPSLPADADVSGIVILEGRDEEHVRNTYLLNLASGELTEITQSGENQFDHFVSPDRTLFAYESMIQDSNLEVIKKELIIAGPDGKVLKAFPWYALKLLGWMDNEHLMLSRVRMDPEQSPGYISEFDLFNAFTGVRKTLRPGVLQYQDSQELPVWDAWYGVVYAPTLDRLVYVQETDKSPYAFIVRDLKNQQVLATVNSFGGLKPYWSSDGSHLVVQAPVKAYADNELFILDQDGKVEQLTNLHQTLELYGDEYSWSPDGRYIAGWALPDKNRVGEPAELVVINIETKNVTGTCVRAKYSGGGYKFHPIAPIWSPDGKQLLVFDWYERNRTHVILVDVEKNFAANVAEDVKPVGWMVAP